MGKSAGATATPAVSRRLRLRIQSLADAAPPFSPPRAARVGIEPREDRFAREARAVAELCVDEWLGRLRTRRRHGSIRY